MATRAKKPPAPPKSPTICLVVMAQDEAPIIERALQSALPYIDRWCVVDHGSMDDTRARVLHTLEGIPGTLHEREWVDFGYNRSQALDLARAEGTDYCLIMDADQTLEVRDPACLAGLTADVYDVKIKHGVLEYPHPWLIRSTLEAGWDQSTHEYLEVPGDHTLAPLEGLVLVEHADSHRRTTGAKLADDKRLLEEAYADNPHNPRTVFYLAQLCQDLGQVPCAISRYSERIAMGGWVEEVWCSHYRIGRIYEGTGRWEQAVHAYLAAYQCDPSRAEPLYRLGRGYLAQQKFNLGLLFFEAAMLLPKPERRLFLEPAVYDYAARWGYASCLRLRGHHEEAEKQEDRVLAGEHTPANVVAEIAASRLSKAIGVLP